MLLVFSIHNRINPDIPLQTMQSDQQIYPCTMDSQIISLVHLLRYVYAN